MMDNQPHVPDIVVEAGQQVISKVGERKQAHKVNERRVGLAGLIHLYLKWWVGKMKQAMMKEAIPWTMEMILFLVSTSSFLLSFFELKEIWTMKLRKFQARNRAPKTRYWERGS